MTRGLLDTSVLIADLDDWEALPDEACISIISIAELHYGVLKAKDDRARRLRLSRLGDIEEKMPVLPIDSRVARAYATLADAVTKAGRSPRPRCMDLWIAATALTQKLTLYTRNPDDLKGLESLVTIRVVV
jgi:toxin FitB